MDAKMDTKNIQKSTAQGRKHKNEAEASDDIAISISNLEKTYPAQKNGKPVHALKKINFEIKKGDMVALLGPNGAGKSTLINIMAGIVNKTKGEVAIWGMDIDKNPRDSKSAIGVVPQELNVDPFFTPIKLLDFHAGLYGVPKAERKTSQILKSLGLWDKRNAYSRQMSGGMKRRMLIAKAMVHTPPILVLDEPTAGVDISLRRQLWDNIKTLNAAGTTVLLTTHYLEEAEELCDKITVIDGGRIVANDTKQNLLKNMNHKSLIVTFEEKFDLKNTPKNVQSYAQNDKVITFTFKPTETSVMEILNHLNKNVVLDITTKDASLEELFLQLTRK